MSISREEIAAFMRTLQDEITQGLELADGKAKFQEDIWEHESGGGGRSRVIQEGGVFEKGGVNFSAVEGAMPEFMKARVNPNATTFFATGVSLVIHPESPMVPIIHMNVRYFETDTGESWFGGGIDLTPIYVNEAQALFFHEKMKATCDQFDAGYYPKFKEWADNYFFNKHRQETRGIGGIFFDYLKPNETTMKADLFAFVQAVGRTFLPAYLPIVAENRALSFTEKNKQWQLMRRGRYVEFNLVYDRGTRFGLETGGRIESILMSLPAHASWVYNYIPEPGSEEEKTQTYLKK
ncbi:MAG: oxygen-dependent coproporphyrinogen oxidase [Flavobacteriales bacterium]